MGQRSCAWGTHQLPIRIAADFTTNWTISYEIAKFHWHPVPSQLAGYDGIWTNQVCFRIISIRRPRSRSNQMGITSNSNSIASVRHKWPSRLQLLFCHCVLLVVLRVSREKCVIVCLFVLLLLQNRRTRSCRAITATDIFSNDLLCYLSDSDLPLDMHHSSHSGEINKRPHPLIYYRQIRYRLRIGIYKWP